MNNLIEIYTGLTKAQISAFVKDTAKVVTDNGNILETLAQLKAMETIATGLKESLQDYALTKIKKDGNTVQISGIKFTAVKRRTYDFTTDATWNNLKKKTKEREKLLKSLTDPVADTVTGEIIGLPSFKDPEHIKIELP